jgi:hypothetical protein
MEIQFVLLTLPFPLPTFLSSTIMQLRPLDVEDRHATSRDGTPRHTKRRLSTSKVARTSQIRTGRLLVVWSSPHYLVLLDVS